MNKMRKLSALICAGALVVTSIVPAWAAEQTSQNDGAIENMGAQGVSFDAIEVPTITDGMYDFTLDPEKLLKTYGGTAYAAGKTFIFESDDTANPATLKIEEGSGASALDGKLYYESKKEDTTTALTAKLGITGTKGSLVESTTAYYIYVPDRTSESTIAQALGTYVKIKATGDDANLEKYFNVTYDGSNAIDTITFKGDKELPNVCNQKVYVDEYKEITENFSKYVVINDEGKVTGAKEGVIVKAKKASDGSLQDADFDKVTFTPAKTVHTEKSQKVKVVNKSSNDKTVKVKVEVQNGDGLEFADTKAKADALDNTKASVFLRITNGTPAADVYVKKTTKDEVNKYSAVASFDVNGVDLTIGTAVETYMAGVDEKTGGHIFNSYLNPVADSAYSSVEFYLEGGAVDIGAISDADQKKAAQKVWNDYAEGLRSASTVIKPGVTVVYDIKDKVTKETATAANTVNLTGEVDFQDAAAWFALSNGVDASKATAVQWVATTDGVEEVYAVKMSECETDSNWIGVPYGPDGADTVTVLVKVGDKLYTQKLF